MIIVQLPDGTQINVNTDDPKAAAAAGKKYLSDNPQHNPIDKLSQEGASAKARLAVSTVSSPKDRLNAARKYYPDAKPYGEDNFVFTDPKTKQLTLFNPQGIDRGDFVPAGRIAANVIGGVLAAAPASITGPGAIVAGAGGATGAGLLYDQAARAVLGTEDTRGLYDQAKDYAIEGGINLVAPAALSGAVKVAKAAPGAILRTADKAIGPAFERLGIQPSAEAVGSRFVQQASNALRGTLPAANTMINESKRVLGALGDKVTDTVRSVTGAASKAEFGDIAIKAGQRTLDAGVATANKLYAEVDKLIPASARVAATNFKTAVDDMYTKYAGDPEFSDILTSDAAVKFRDAIDEATKRGGMQYQTLVGLRTDLGRMLKARGGKLLESMDAGEVKQLYGAVSDDLITAASAFGKDAVDAATAASSHWKQFRSVIDDVVEPMIGTARNPKAPEKVFDYVRTVAEETPSRLSPMANVFNPAEREAMGAGIFRDMGRANSGAQNAEGDVWSAASFLTNYDKLGKNGAGEAMDFFFPTIRNTVDDVAKASQGLKDAGTTFNYSNTAGALANIGMATSAITNPIATAATAAGLWGTAKGLTSDAMVNFLKKAPAAGPAMAPTTAVGTGVLASEAAQAPMQGNNGLIWDEADQTYLDKDGVIYDKNLNPIGGTVYYDLPQ
jgi:hypothetical protein